MANMDNMFKRKFIALSPSLTDLQMKKATCIFWSMHSMHVDPSDHFVPMATSKDYIEKCLIEKVVMPDIPLNPSIRVKNLVFLLQAIGIIVMATVDLVILKQFGNCRGGKSNLLEVTLLYRLILVRKFNLKFNALRTFMSTGNDLEQKVARNRSTLCLIPLPLQNFSSSLAIDR